MSISVMKPRPYLLKLGAPIVSPWQIDEVGSICLYFTLVFMLRNPIFYNIPASPLCLLPVRCPDLCPCRILAFAVVILPAKVITDSKGSA